MPIPHHVSKMGLIGALGARAGEARGRAAAQLRIRPERRHAPTPPAQACQDHCASSRVPMSPDEWEEQPPLKLPRRLRGGSSSNRCGRPRGRPANEGDKPLRTGEEDGEDQVQARVAAGRRAGAPPAMGAASPSPPPPSGSAAWRRPPAPAASALAPPASDSAGGRAHIDSGTIRKQSEYGVLEAAAFVAPRPQGVVFQRLRLQHQGFV